MILHTLDEYQSQLLIGGTTIVVNKQTCSQINGVNSYDINRSAPVFPIVGAKTNAALTPVAIKVQMTRSSGDDALTIGGTTTVNNGTLIIQEIAN